MSPKKEKKKNETIFLPFINCEIKIISNKKKNLCCWFFFFFKKDRFVLFLI